MHPLAMVVTGQCGHEIVQAELIECPGISQWISLLHQLLDGITQLADTFANLLPLGFELCAVNGLLVARLKAPLQHSYETLQPISSSKVDSSKKMSGRARQTDPKIQSCLLRSPSVNLSHQRKVTYVFHERRRPILRSWHHQWFLAARDTRCIAPPCVMCSWPPCR